MALFGNIVLVPDTRGNQPAASAVASGSLYYVTDEAVLERSNLSSWEQFSSSGDLPVVASGDILYGSGTTLTALSVGATNEVLTVAGGLPTWAAPNASGQRAAVGAMFGDGVNVISGTAQAMLQVPFNATIVAARLLLKESGDLVIDVWKDTYANYPPTDVDSICSGVEPTASSAIKYENLTLSGWTTSITSGDCLTFHVDSASTVTQATIVLELEKV